MSKTSDDVLAPSTDNCSSVTTAAESSSQTFVWDDCFITGLAHIDDQHQQLINLINQFSERLTHQDRREANLLDGVFEALAEYAQQHFAEEEALMARAGVDQRHFLEHRNEHQRFLDEVMKLHEHCVSGDKDTDSALVDFLVHWLAYHILGKDQLMAEQIRLIESGLSPADAFDQADSLNRGAIKPLIKALAALFKQISIRNRELMELKRTLKLKMYQSHGENKKIERLE